MSRNFLLGGLCLFLSVSGAQAQNHVTYVDFEGRAFIFSNPTSATCKASNINYGDDYTVVYRFSLSPSVVSDALAFVTGRSDFRIVSTQSPSFSLNNVVVGGPSTTNWDYISSRAGVAGGPIPSSSNLFMEKGAGGPLTATSQFFIMSGTVNDFLGVAGCAVTIRAGGPARPN